MTAPKPSDLGTRVLSAIVMLVVAGAALWLGGWVFTMFVVAVGLGVIWEYWALASKIAKTPLGAAVWLAAGVSYVGVAMAVLVAQRAVGLYWTLLPIIYVIAVDVGAYFAGRTLGGPKIAPSISPSKTWAGLIGGIVAATIVTLAYGWVYYGVADWASGPSLPEDVTPEGPVRTIGSYLAALIPATIVAIVAQSGDFFESWMKRRAGVKDSGTLIPGHGGLFDRVDGLLAVLFVSGAFYIVMNFDNFALTPSPG